MKIVALMASTITAVASIIACSTLPPTVPEVVGQRHVVVTVDNQSNRPAIVFVAADVHFGDPEWRAVGGVSPAIVAPRTKTRIVISPPSSGTWAFWVNPGPESRRLFTWRGMPADFSGELPGFIVVDVNGQPGLPVFESVPPGWCDGDGEYFGCN